MVKKNTVKAIRPKPPEAVDLELARAMRSVDRSKKVAYKIAMKILAS